MGDLNYRITRLDAAEMVERTARAARQARRILLQQQQQLQPAAGPQWAGSALGLPMPLGLAMEHAAAAAATAASGKGGEEEDSSGRGVHFGLPSQPSRGVSFQDNHDHDHDEEEEEATRPPSGGGRVSWVRERYLRLFPHVPTQAASSSSLLGAWARDGSGPVAATGEGEGVALSPPRVGGEEREGEGEVELEIGPVGLVSGSTAGLLSFPARFFPLYPLSPPPVRPSIPWMPLDAG